MSCMRFSCILSCLLGAASSWAEPVVVYKGEPVVSADPYRSAPKATLSTPIKRTPREVIRMALLDVQKSVRETPQPPPFTVPPYKTEGLSLGKVESKSDNLPEIPRPFFLVGGDEHSRAWLKKNKDKFKAAEAIGFLVEAKSWDEVKLIQEIAGEVAIVRFQGGDWLQKLGVNRYPVFVTTTSIEQ